MISWYKYIIVSLFSSSLGFWSGNLFLIAPFPDRCLLVPFCADYRSKIIDCPGLLIITFLNIGDFEVIWQFTLISVLTDSYSLLTDSLYSLVHVLNKI